MEILYVVGAVILVGLIVLGTTQRKKLQTIVRSETKDYLDKKSNTIKVANLKISDLRDSAKKAAQKAGKLYAHEKQQRSQLEDLQAKTVKFLNDAKIAKSEDNKDKAIKYLELKEETDKQIKIVSDNIETLEGRRHILELNIEKIKSFIAKHKIQLSGLEARQATNELLKDMHVGSLDENTLEETIDNVESKIETEELEIEYASENDIFTEESITTEEMEKKFKEL